MNAVFQRIARRDKKAFLSDQCKEIEENKEWDRLEIFSRKLEIPRTIHAMMGTIKDKNDMDLTEVEDIEKRWPEYKEKLYKKRDLHDPDNPKGVITHLEPDILKYKVK